MRRFILVFVFLLLSWAALANFVLSQYRYREAFGAARQNLLSIASNAALSIDAQVLQQIPLVESGDKSAAYQEIFDKLIQIKQANPPVKYVYVMAATAEPGILQYVVDADPAPEIITANSPRALPGDKYDARGFPELLSAYNGPAADKKITRDPWGAFISGYAPVRDAQNRPAAILGVDMDAGGVQKLKERARSNILLALGASFLFLISLFGALLPPKTTVKAV